MQDCAVSYSDLKKIRKQKAKAAYQTHGNKTSSN